jgi:large subunit ribosomal protein L6
MSRIGNRPIEIPTGVDIAIDKNNHVQVKGPRGELSLVASANMKLSRDNGTLLVERPNNERENRSLHGLTRTLINNMVLGVTTGYTRTLEITGVGYRAALDGTTLVLSVGFSHQVRMTPPEGITYSLEGQNRIHIAGIDKQAVGEEAARVRRVRPPEPYKGKGIRYSGEVVRRKAGKAGKAK